MQCHMAASLVFRLHDRGPEVVREVLLERGWEEYDQEEREEEDWNLYWRGSSFRSSEYHNVLPWQRLNHHPQTAGITRKDFLARNLRRMRATFGSALYDFSPATFILPNDYIRFLSEYDELRLTAGSAYWICKPVDLSRGRGIFVFEDIKDLVYDCSVIVQRYVCDPLLISGYKFDLRIYACVKSFHPLTVYLHQEGLVRFATEKYDLSSLRNLYAHLTNTSINKLGPFYQTRKERVGRGCKWTMSKFRHFLHGQDVDELLLWQRINNIVTLTLLAIAPSVPSCPNCVELFGFDVLIDAAFKPWLLEVNYSPALNLDCQVDIAVKKGLIGDLIDLMHYTRVDSLRENAYREHKQPRFRANHVHSHVSRPPVLSEFRETAFQKQQTRGRSSQTLPLIKSVKTKQRRHAFMANYQRHLPPVDITRCRLLNSTDKTLNLILGRSSRTNEEAVNRQTCPSLAPWLMDNRSLHVSEVTDRETEAEPERSGETDVSSLTCDTRRGGLGFRRAKLPDICSGSRRAVRKEKPAALNEQQVPPLRVGDFIRTFPFNRATLRASQHRLDIKTVIQEIHKLTVYVATPGRKMRRDKKEVKEMDDEEDFDSLLWGPKDPPLLSQCFTST